MIHDIPILERVDAGGASVLITSRTELEDARAIDTIGTAEIDSASFSSAEKKGGGVGSETLILVNDRLDIHEQLERLEEIGDEKFLQQWRAVFVDEAVE